MQGWVANYFMTAEKWDESHKTSKNVWFILQGHRFLFFFLNKNSLSEIATHLYLSCTQQYVSKFIIRN